MMVSDSSSMKCNREMVQLRMLTDYADCINREDLNETRQLFDELTASVREVFVVEISNPSLLKLKVRF